MRLFGLHLTWSRFFVYEPDNTTPASLHQRQNSWEGKRGMLLIKDNNKTGEPLRAEIWRKRASKQASKQKSERKTNGVRVRTDEKNKWSVSVEVLQRGGKTGVGEGEGSDANAYTLPWSECTPDDLCSLSNIEPAERKTTSHWTTDGFILKG